MVWLCLVPAETGHLVSYCQDGAECCRSGIFVANALSFDTIFWCVKVRVRKSAVWVVLGSWKRLISHSVHFASHRSHYASVFVSIAAITLLVVVLFAR